MTLRIASGRLVYLIAAVALRIRDPQSRGNLPAKHAKGRETEKRRALTTDHTEDTDQRPLGFETLQSPLLRSVLSV